MCSMQLAQKSSAEVAGSQRHHAPRAAREVIGQACSVSRGSLVSAAATIIFVCGILGGLNVFDK